MNTYKLGNKVTCIIRAYSSGKIGDMVIDYNNQPYTIVKSVNANLSFADVDVNIKSSFNQLAYNNNKLSQIQINDVTLNDKILNLIFLKSETKLVSKIENQIADIFYIEAKKEMICYFDKFLEDYNPTINMNKKQKRSKIQKCNFNIYNEYSSILFRSEKLCFK